MEIFTALFVVLVLVWIGDRQQMKRRFERAWKIVQNFSKRQHAAEQEAEEWKAKAHALEAQLLELQAYPYHCPQCAATLESANSPTTDDLLKALIKYNEGAVWL
jgi:hypothetical protein